MQMRTVPKEWWATTVGENWVPTWLWSRAANQPGWLTAGLLYEREIHYFLKPLYFGASYFFTAETFILSDTVSPKRMHVILVWPFWIKVFQSLPKQCSVLIHLSRMGTSVNLKPFRQVQWLVQWLWASFILSFTLHDIWRKLHWIITFKKFSL